MECEQALPGHVLRQGDIFAAHPGTENWTNPWRRFGVILTADCDLEQQKGGPSLVYVPIIGLKTYLADVWIPDHAAGLFELATRQAEKALAELNDHRVTPRHLLRQSAEEISKQLGMPVPEVGAAADEIAGESKSEDTKSRDKARRKQFDRIIRLRDALSVLSDLKAPKDPSGAPQLGEMLDRLFPQHEYVKPIGKPGPAARRDLVYSSLSDLIQESRVDTWPISDLVAMDPEMRADEDFGFVVDLRRFAVLETAKIQTSRATWLGGPDYYLRICRLRGLYKSALMQKFANLFVRVGLDDSRKDLNLEMFSRLSKRLVPGE